MANLPQYKGYRVEVSDDGMFRAYVEKGGNLIAEATSLNALKEKVDKLSKAKFGFDVWIDKDGRYRKGHLTSAQERRSRYGPGSLEFRVTVKVGKTTEWDELQADSIYKDTEENRALVEAINRQRDAIKKAEETVEDLEMNLASFTEDELMGAK